MVKLRSSFTFAPMVCLTYGMAAGLDADELCSSCQIASEDLSDPWRVVPGDWPARMWRVLLDRLPQADVGIGLGLYTRLEHFGPAGEILRYSGSGLEFLHAAGRIAYLMGLAECDRDVEIVESGERVGVVLPPLSDAPAEQAEAWSVFVVKTLRELSPRAIALTLVQVAHSFTQRRACAARFYACEIEWNRKQHALWFERQSLITIWPGGNREVARSFERWVDQKLIGPARSRFARRVLLALELAVKRGDSSQAAIARALGVSVRSLQRRLRTEGSSYGQLHATALRNVGIGLLGDGARSTDEIALSLGYSDAGSFARAWKRLTGDTPARFRAQLGAPARLFAETSFAPESKAS